LVSFCIRTVLGKRLSKFANGQELEISRMKLEQKVTLIFRVVLGIIDDSRLVNSDLNRLREDILKLISNYALLLRSFSGVEVITEDSLMTKYTYLLCALDCLLLR